LRRRRRPGRRARPARRRARGRARPLPRRDPRAPEPAPHPHEAGYAATLKSPDQDRGGLSMAGRGHPTCRRRRACDFARLSALHGVRGVGPALAIAPGMRAARTLPLRLGPYLLTDLIGVGGMAAVYRSRRRGNSGFETAAIVKV